MAAANDADGLQIKTDERFDRIQWRVERVAWVLMGLLVLLALLGLAGGGSPLMETSVSSGQSEVSYNRIVRFQGVSRIDLVVPARDEGARVSFNEAYISAMEVESVSPEPESVETSADEIVYIFSSVEGAETASVTFNLRPERIGMYRARIQTDDGDLSFRQFALP